MKSTHILLSVIAGILIGIGGIGMNTTNITPDKFYYEACLGIGFMVYVIYAILKYRERRQNQNISS